MRRYEFLVCPVRQQRAHPAGDKAAVIDEAKRLSAAHTLAGGHRGFDILHAAAALVIGADQFLTFDRNQKRLAQAEGLEAPLG